MSIHPGNGLLCDLFNGQVYSLSGPSNKPLYYPHPSYMCLIACSVYNGIRLSDMHPCDVKVISAAYFPSGLSLFQPEIDELVLVNHPHVVDIIGHGMGILTFPDNIPGSGFGIVQYVSLEKLYDQSQFPTPHSTGIAAELALSSQFNQLLQTICFLRGCGLPLHNINADKIKWSAGGIMKIGGFGSIYGISSSPVCIEPYTAPEVQDNTFPTGYEPMMSVVYSLGIILSELKFGPTFKNNIEPFPRSNEYFQKDSSWNTLSILFSNPISIQLRDLLKSMLHPDPLSRPKLLELLSNPWVYGSHAPEAFPEGTNDPTFS